MRLAGKSTIINSTDPNQLTNWLGQQFNRLIPNIAEQPHQLDLKFIAPETKTSITINQVKKSIHWLNTPPYQSAHKILVFCPADQLTLPAQNALLKPLEEPPYQAFIVLATNQPSKLLDTIASRCFIISLLPSVNQLPVLSNQLKQLINTLNHSNTSKRLALLPKKGLDQNTVSQHLAELVQAVVQSSPTPTFSLSHQAKILELISLAYQRINSFVTPETVLADLYLAWPARSGLHRNARVQEVRPLKDELLNDGRRTSSKGNNNFDRHLLGRCRRGTGVVNR